MFGPNEKLWFLALGATLSMSGCHPGSAVSHSGVRLKASCHVPLMGTEKPERVCMHACCEGVTGTGCPCSCMHVSLLDDVQMEKQGAEVWSVFGSGYLHGRGHRSVGGQLIAPGH